MLTLKLRSFIPSEIRRVLHNFYREIIWRKAFREYVKIIESGEVPNKMLIKRLIYSWGNQGFSAKACYIESIITHSLNTSGLIFECGSGLTTILIGVIAKRKKIPAVSLEHHPFWAGKVQHLINKYNLTNSIEIFSELIDYGLYHWYNISGIDISGISLCICDAPPGDTNGGRSGFLYLLHKKMLPNAKILVYDTIREAERRMICDWDKLFNLDIEFVEKEDQFAVLTIK